jgi:hypothetical protein
MFLQPEHSDSMKSHLLPQQQHDWLVSNGKARIKLLPLTPGTTNRNFSASLDPLDCRAKLPLPPPIYFNFIHDKYL